MILSIDVGTKNMGVAIVDREGPTLKDFRLLCCTCVKKPTIERSCKDVFQELTAYLDSLDHDIDECMIEAQPRKNCRTKVLSHCIQVLMLGRGCAKIKFVSPKKKLKVKYAKYKDRKKAAVEEAKRVGWQEGFAAGFAAGAIEGPNYELTEQGQALVAKGKGKGKRFQPY